MFLQSSDLLIHTDTLMNHLDPTLNLPRTSSSSQHDYVISVLSQASGSNTFVHAH